MRPFGRTAVARPDSAPGLAGEANSRKAHLDWKVLAAAISERERTEQSLRESEKRYRTLAEASPDAIFILGRDLKVQYANSAAAGLWGSPPTALIGRKQEELFPPEVARHHSQVIRKVFETGMATCRDEPIPFPGGQRWLETRLVPIRDDHGGVASVLGVARDITDRKRTEFLLQAQRDVGVSLSLTSDLKAALDRLLEIAVQIEGVDCGGVYLVDAVTGEVRLTAHRGLSAAFVEQVSYYPATAPNAQLVHRGQPIYTLFRSLKDFQNPAMAQEGLRAIAILPLCDEGVVLGCLNLASHVHDVISAQARVVLEAVAAQAAGAISRIRMEEALHATEARLRMVIAELPIVLFAVDGQGVITYEGGQALRPLGFKPGTTIGRSLAEVFRRFPMLLEYSRRALRGERFSALLEMDAMCLNCWYSPTRDERGKSNGFIGVAVDVTERQKLERQILEISDREQARIGQDIHDGLCQQLVSLAFDANSLHNALAARGQPEAATAGRIAELLDHAISESRQLSRGMFPVRLEAEGLAPALTELANSTRERHGLPCVFRGPRRSLAVPNAVAIHLYRIAQEAVNNAVRHGRPRKITISLRAGAGEVFLQVEDDGRGISRQPRRKSGGMGLRIMDYRARSIGGRLEVGPRTQGGTLVLCCVPRALS